MRWFMLKQPEPLKDFRREMEGHRLQRRYPRGLVSVPVDKVVGSLNKSGSMNRRFRYKSGKVDARLRRLRLANQWGMVALPPVELYQLGDEYYVVDGHHRMAIALENHQIEIDANVVAHEIERVVSHQSPVASGPGGAGRLGGWFGRGASEAPAR